MKQSRTPMRWRFRPRVVLFLAISLIAGQVGESKASQRLDCQAPAVNDYLAPFDLMPRPRPPAERDLRVGGIGLSLNEITFSRVISGRGSYGYAAGIADEQGRSVADLDWTVEAELQLLNKKGVVRRIARRSRWRVPDSRALASKVFSLRVSAPGLYRFVLRFTDSGGVLKSFSQYVRGVRRNPKALLFMDQESYRAGESATVQLANPGTETIRFGEGGMVSVLSEGHWTPVLRLPSRGKKKALGLNPGQRWVCETFSLPPTLSSGRYRVEKTVSFLSPGGGPKAIVQEFQLLE